MEPGDPRSDDDLVLAIAAGDAAAVQAFKHRHAAALNRICASVAPDARSAAAACGDLMGTADFTALFAGFDGRSTWKTFVPGAVLSRFLFPRLLRRIATDPSRSVADFEAFFRDDIDRAVRAVVFRQDLREDAAQWIWVRLLAREGEQLLKFAQEARTPGFVIEKLKLLAQDFKNSADAPQGGRKRTLPDCLKACSAFDQAVYKQFYWWHVESAANAMLALRPNHRDVTEDAVREARVRVEAILQANGGIIVIDRETRTLDDDLIKVLTSSNQPTDSDEVEAAAFRKALLRAAKDLPSLEVLCLMKRLEGLAAGEIAADLGITSKACYEIMRSLIKNLRKTLSTDQAARERIATVTGNDSYIAIDATAGSGRKPAPKPRKGTDR